MIVVFVNCLSVILGSLVGLIFSKKISEEFSTVIQTAAGFLSLLLGIQMALTYENIVFLSLSLMLGGLIGTKLDINSRILKIGLFLQNIVLHEKKSIINGENKKSESSAMASSNFSNAFLNASLLFCVGAMAIVGSFKAGIEKDYSVIFTKSILDGFIAISFAASSGLGTLFSFLAILLYQGFLTLLAQYLAPFFSQVLITELSACGGILIMMIGINLLKLKEIKTANFLPALIVELIFVVASSFFN
ncbi:MAG: DUF554 domain-containing protein [Treponema sp.]|nr:DUF554 domain-containing protein [Treponema sp.]